MLIAALAITLLSIVPFEDEGRVIVEDRGEVIEVNHYYDDRGDLVFSQLILWDTYTSTKPGELPSFLQVVAWRMIKNPFTRPRRIHDGYSASWMDGEVMRRVSAPVMHETWTQHDREVDARDEFPKARRRELTSPAPLKRYEPPTVQERPDADIFIS